MNSPLLPFTTNNDTLLSNKIIKNPVSSHLLGKKKEEENCVE
jgi:hypothetical protein